MKREDLLDLNDILQHPGRELAVDISTELPEEEDVDLLNPIEGFLEAVSTGNALLLNGKFETRIVMECARCAGPLEVDLTFDIDEQFPIEGTPSSLNPQDYARVVADEPFELFDGNSLMVENLIRQGLHLAIPMQQLCEFGWEGDCPRASDVQVGRTTAMRPEFDKLSNLLEKGDSVGESGEEPA